MDITGIGDRLATTIVTQALCWPDAFPASDAALQRAAGLSSVLELRERAEAWRPWRAYAAMHLWLADAGR
jgi:AraC family transcriptional regulator of adaptative response / DNA-3-methyladenine glycosylase II